MRRSIWPVLVFAAVTSSILIALGLWQLNRLAWKEKLIATIDQGIAAAAVDLPEAKKRPVPGYARIRLSGTFLSQDYILVIATLNGGPAWNVVRPFALDDGSVILVDLGKSREATPPLPPAGHIATEALLRVPADRQGYFDPDNPRQGKQWFWWDVPAMAEALGATETGFFARLLPGQPGTDGLAAEAPRAEIRNNHLSYAITWFGLAAVVVVMSGLFLLRLPRKAANGTP